MNTRILALSFLLASAASACGTNPGNGVDTDAVDDTSSDVGPADAGDTSDDIDAGDIAQPDAEDVAPEVDTTPDGDDDVSPPECIDWSSPLNQRVANSPEECAAIDFLCSQSEAYSDACGCGCRFEPPVCPDPDAPGVQYVATSTAECAEIDFDCGSRTFEGPCGCGCLDCRAEETPNLNYVATDADTCAVIDFGCPEGWSGFDDAACGCGCEVSECRPEKIFGTSGMAAPFRLDAQCEFLIACSPLPLAENGLREAFEVFFDEPRCGDGSAFGCPDGTRSFCEPYIAQVEASDVVAACAISMLEGVNRMLCGGDL